MLVMLYASSWLEPGCSGSCKHLGRSAVSVCLYLRICVSAFPRLDLIVYSGAPMLNYLIMWKANVIYVHFRETHFQQLRSRWTQRKPDTLLKRHSVYLWDMLPKVLKNNEGALEWLMLELAYNGNINYVQRFKIQYMRLLVAKSGEKCQLFTTEFKFT